MVPLASAKSLIRGILMDIRFIGGLWRRIEGSSVRSFSTYQEAVDNKNAWEDFLPKVTSDDIVQQLQNLK